MTWTLRKGTDWEKQLDITKPLIMGILNVTPDSFSDGGKYNAVDAAIAHAKQMVAEGADIIDIGGESTKPGSDSISVEEELNRVLPVITALSKENGVILSIDTYKPEVALQCLEAGAHMVNDITGLMNEEMVAIVKDHDAAAVMMHMQGTPKTMQEAPHYDDCVAEIHSFFHSQIVKIKNHITKLILDPGIGFGKSREDNLAILARLAEFKDLGYPILIGTSRKSFLGGSIDERLPGTIASNVIAYSNGATIFRVHDVKEIKSAIKLVHEIKNKK